MSVTHCILALGAKAMKLKYFQYYFSPGVLVPLSKKKKKPYDLYYGYLLITKADMTDIAGMSLFLDSSKDLCVLPGCLILQSKIIPDMRFHFIGN